MLDLPEAAQYEYLLRQDKSKWSGRPGPVVATRCTALDIDALPPLWTPKAHEGVVMMLDWLNCLV